MPDWSYQPVLRPLLFRLPPVRARTLTLGAMAWLAHVPLGSRVIELLGHMSPPSSLERRLCGLRVPSLVGLDAGLDVEAIGVQPLSQFGFGFLEVGPVTAEPVTGDPPWRLPDEEAIGYPDQPINTGLRVIAERLRHAQSRVPVGARLALTPGSSVAEATVERKAMMEALSAHVAFFTVETRGCLSWSAEEWRRHLREIVTAAGDKPVFLVLSPDLTLASVSDHLGCGVAEGVAGVFISGGISERGGRVDGRTTYAPTLSLLRSLRTAFPELSVVAGSVHEPAQALELLASGAALVTVHAGLVYSGPGLPKRINEAIAHELQVAAESRLAPAELKQKRAAQGRGWFAAALMAAGIGVGALLASWVALTRVVLSYDEAFVGLSRSQLRAVNPRLLAFMTHDRISLTGTMAASAWLYFMIALSPWRRGEHWARPTFLVPASVGFLTFLLFPTYGYLEPLHTLFYLCLLPFFLAAAFGRQKAEPAALPTSLTNDRAWRLGLWGQLFWIVLAAGGTVAGLTIMAIGATRVFVPEDLAFMGTTAEFLRSIPHLIPLIAHDRFGFGTALTCNGLTVLLISLWGYRRGARWLWWTLALAGVPSYAAAFGVHIAVGYTNLWHLTPPIVGLALLLAALAFSRPYLCATSDTPEKEGAG